MILLLSVTLFSCKEEKEEVIQEEEIQETKQIYVTITDSIPTQEWQKVATFPDRLGKADDTLAMNSIIGFEYFEDQGELYIQSNADSFDLFINSHKADTSFGKGICQIDFSEVSVNGINSLQLSSIENGTVDVYIPYPIVIEGDLKEEGFHEETFKLISDIISSDVEYGFPGAQLAVIRNNRLVYSNHWGYLNSYEKDGSRISDPVPVNNETLFDLASVTKMFSANYAIQKLVSEGKISLEDKVYEYLGERFYEDTMDFVYDFGADPSLYEMKKWKASITIEDLLKHQAGFPPSPRYFNLHVDGPSQEYLDDGYNILYAGSEHSKETKENTVEAICRTPLQYEPGSRSLYSDVDYMILGLIVEEVSQTDLDSYLKENFFDPMELKHITYNPLENGFTKEDCAATELNGNTRDGVIDFPGIRTETIQGEAHDEMAWYSMNGVSGHAGLFSNAEDLARLASLMFTGGYGKYHFFDRNVIDTFISPNGINNSNSGLGWARQGDDQRSWYFGSTTASDTIGHQGWTGTLVMIDFERNIVMVYLTNLRNTPLPDPEANANDFSGLYYTASTLGFVPELFSIGLDQDEDVHEQLLSLLKSMCEDSEKLVPIDADEKDPAYLSYLSKQDVYRKWISE